MLIFAFRIQLDRVQIYLKLNQIENSLLFANKSFDISKELGTQSGILESKILLAKINYQKNQTKAIEQLENVLETVSVDELIPQTGIDFKTIKQAASLIAQKKKIIIYFIGGITYAEIAAIRFLQILSYSIYTILGIF